MKPFELKAHQKKIGLAFCAIIVLVIALLVYLANNNKPQRISLPPQTRINLANPAHGVKVEDLLVQRHGNKLDALDKRIEAMNRVLEQLRLKEQIPIKEQTPSVENSLIGRINELEQEIANIRKVPQVKVQQNVDKSMQSRISTVQSISAKQSKPRTLQNYLPAGSYVEAEIISSVDAGVGISAQSDARPVLLRLTDKAKSRMYRGKLQEIDIKGCTVTASAYGDLSSEQIFVRLDKLICSNQYNETIERDVEGYITNNGKVGIRGTVVRREGDLLTKSFLAGLVSGAGNALTQSLNTPVLLPGGQGSKQNDEYRGIIMGGVSQGVGNSSSKLSEYYIQRAEQHQPVITVPGGIKVEAVFSKGVYLDEDSN